MSDSLGVAVEANGLGKVYRKAGESVPVLSDVHVSFQPGERVAIVGPSGSGKSTFLHLIGLLDRPTAGSLKLSGVDVGALDAAGRDRIRRFRVGFIFQAHNLLPDLTALHNVSVPARLAGGTRATAEARAGALLEAVGLSHRLTHRPGELSGGEQQRVAIARALVMAPGLILADEPTGNLDPATAGGVFDLLLQLHDQLGSTLVVVTHSHEIANRFPRRLAVQDGHFVEAA